MVDSPPPGPSNFITTSGSANRYARPGRLHSESKEIRAGPYSGSPVPRNSLTSGPRESFTPRVQGWGDSRLRAPSILPQGTKLFSSVPPYGFTLIPLCRLYLRPLQRHFHSLGLKKPVYATAQIRPCGPCQPTAAMAGPTFSYLRNPDPPLSGGLHNLHGRLQSGLGRSHGGFQDFGYLDPYRPQAPHQLSALGSSASGPPGHNRYGHFDSGFIYQQAGRDSLHFPATLDCRAFPLVRVTRHNSLGKTHSRLPERDSRPPISSESANTDRVVPTPRDRGTHLQVLGDTRSRHVCDTVELPPSSVHVSSSGAKSPNGGCSVSRLAGEVNVHVSTFSPAQQGRAEIRSTQVAEVILVAPWWPSQPWFPHLLRLCVEHPLILPYRQDLLSQQDQKYISDGKSFHLYVWRLSCDTTKQQAFQTRSLGSRQLLGDPRPIACTTTDGVVLHDGLRDKVLTHLSSQPLR